MKDPELYSVHKVWIACYRHRYGSGMLEDNFVARVYTSYKTEGHFSAFYFIFWLFYFTFWAFTLFHFYFFRYGSGMLEDNLVARVYTSYETEGHFLAFYTVLNCYVYLLAYVYSPTSTQVYKHMKRLIRKIFFKNNFIY